MKIRNFIRAQLFCLLVAGNCFAAPILVNLGPNKVVTGVTTAADGTSYLSGYSIDPTTLNRTGILVTVPAGGANFQVTSLGSILGFTDYIATAISGNYIVGRGSNGQVDNGFAWTIDNSGVAIPVQSVSAPGIPDSAFLLGVNSSGTYVGSSAASSLPTKGTVGGSSVALPAPSSVAYGSGVSEQGTVVGIIQPDSTDLVLPTVWEGTNSLTLSTSILSGDLGQGFLYSISDNDQLIGGNVGVFDPNSESVKFQASVWSGEQWSQITTLSLAGDIPLFGQVLAVTDNGYAVGRSEQGGFIWHEGWQFAQLFNNWASAEYGISLPSWVVSVNDVFFDGANLDFALQGSAYFFSAPISNNSAVPEPATNIMLLFSIVLFAANRRKVIPRVTNFC